MCVFFSSRRRHTRWPRDWSSDVCSSDLNVFGVENPHCYPIRSRDTLHEAEPSGGPCTPSPIWRLQRWRWICCRLLLNIVSVSDDPRNDSHPPAESRDQHRVLLYLCPPASERHC